jgi:hypothetical protein
MEKHRTLRKKQIWIQQIISKRIAKKSDSANCQQKYRRKFESAKLSAKKFRIQQIISRKFSHSANIQQK